MCEAWTLGLGNCDAIFTNVFFKQTQPNVTSKSAKIKCWLLPVKTIFENSKPPSINPVLENASGFSSDTENVK